MNGSAKKLMAVIMVTAMIASAMVIVFTDEQDSSAAANNDFYYGELESNHLAKNLYEKMGEITVFGTDSGPFTANGSITVSYTSEDTAGIAAMDGDKEGYVVKEILKAVDAWSWNDPLNNYYYRSFRYDIETDPSKVTFEPIPYDMTTFTGVISSVDSTLSEWIDSTATVVDISSGTEYEKIKRIHDYVAKTLTYDTANTGLDPNDPANAETIGRIRSAYTAFNPADNLVVCEGYAKMFKVLCDRAGIECLIVTGLADGSNGWEAHMWNYVNYDGDWYVVDCTWDDNGTDSPEQNYLLAGTNKTIGSTKVGDTHHPGTSPCGYTKYYTLPALSAFSVNSSGIKETGVSHEVTFKVDDTVFVQSNAVHGEPVANPGEPTKSGWNFIEWRLEGSDEPYDFSTPVTEDLTIVAVMTEHQVYKLKYDTAGGSVIQSTVVEKPEGEGNPPVNVKVTDSVPIKEGYKFKEWNTSKDGKGISYKSGDEVTLIGDGTLYAIWEDTSSVSYKIDNVIDKAAEFLSKETIPGVSNLLLTIGVITTVVSLLAVLAIARK